MRGRLCLYLTEADGMCGRIRCQSFVRLPSPVKTGKAFRWSAAVASDRRLRIWKDPHMTRFCASSRGSLIAHRASLEVFRSATQSWLPTATAVFEEVDEIQSCTKPLTTTPTPQARNVPCMNPNRRYRLNNNKPESTALVLNRKPALRKDIYI